MRELAVGPWGWEKSAAKSRVHCLSRARRPLSAADSAGRPSEAEAKRLSAIRKPWESINAAVIRLAKTAATGA